jgi:hypothetical protein
MPEPHRYKRTLLALALALAAPFPVLLSAPGEAFAQAGAAGGEVTGVVLEIEQDDIILDIGSDRGAAEGDTVEIWRPLKLKHPVTGKLFTDRFLIGTLKLGQVRPALSLSKAEGSLARDPVKGDVVIMASKAPRPRAPEAQPERPTPEPPGADPGAPQDAEVAAIGKMLDKLRGADPVQRIRVYEDYVRTQPKGRFARFLYEEAQALRKVYELERKRQSEGGAKEPKTPRELGEEPTLRSFEKPATAVGGQPLRLAVELSEKATGAVLHVRGAGQPGYVSLPMASSGNGYFAGTVPKESMTGSLLEFFIEASMPNGAVVPVVGQSAQPEIIDLERPALPSLKTEAVGSVVLSTDFADYNRLLGNDYAWQTEGYFQMRYGDVGVRALRTGFGVYRGKGGTVRELDEEGLAPREVGLTYGYLELEAAPTKVFSIIGRLVVGLENDGVAGGGQLMVRIGNDQQTNLQIGGELLGSVGARGITQLELNTFRRYPIVLRIEVTNQPAGGDVSLDQRDKEGLAKGAAEVGGRGIAQVGWRIVDPLVVSVRGSFQGRNINHAGPGFGGAVSYTW